MKRKTVLRLILFVSVFISVLLIYGFFDIFLLVLASVIFSYLLWPVVRGFLSHSVPMVAAIFVSYGIILLVILFCVIVLLPRVYSELISLFDVLPRYVEMIRSAWEQYFSRSGLLPYLYDLGLFQRFSSYIANQLSGGADCVMAFLRSLPRLLLYSFLVPVLSFYFLHDKESITGNFLAVLPPRFRGEAVLLWEETDAVLRGFIRGSILVSVFVSVLASAGLFFLGMDYAIVFGILYGLFDIIPYFGPVLGTVIILLFAFLQGEVSLWGVFLLLFLIEQGESFFISPRVLGSYVGLHPVTVILLVLIGGGFGGIFGMILMIPFGAVGKVVLFFFYKRFVAAVTD